MRDCRRRFGRFGCCDCAMCDVSPGYASRCRRWLGLLAGSASLSCADSPSRIAWLCCLSGLGSLGSFLAFGRDRPLAYLFPAFTWVVSPACCCGDLWFAVPLARTSVLLAACTLVYGSLALLAPPGVWRFLRGFAAVRVFPACMLFLPVATAVALPSNANWCFAELLQRCLRNGCGGW